MGQTGGRRDGRATLQYVPTPLMRQPYNNSESR